MPRVLCTLPNASDLINGVRFIPDRGQAISEEVPLEVAERFARISGYRLIPDPPPSDPPAPVVETAPPEPDPAPDPAPPVAEVPPPVLAPPQRRHGRGRGAPE